MNKKLVCGSFSIQRSQNGPHIFGTIKTQGDWRKSSEGSEALGEAKAQLQIASLNEFPGLKAILMDGDTVNFTYPIIGVPSSQQILTMRIFGEKMARMLNADIDRTVSGAGAAL